MGREQRGGIRHLLHSRSLQREASHYILLSVGKLATGNIADTEEGIWSIDFGDEYHFLSEIPNPFGQLFALNRG
jgi:hypothetical protein